MLAISASVPATTLQEMCDGGDFDGAWVVMEALGEAGMLTAWDCGVMLKAGQNSPVATENLLENTDGVLRPPMEEGRAGRSTPSVRSRCGSLLLSPSASADVRSPDDVIPFEGMLLVRAKCNTAEGDNAKVR